MLRTNRIRNLNGFTLIEVVVTIGLFGILSLCTANLLLSAEMTQAHTGKKDGCYTIAKSICEKYLSENGVVPHKTVILYLDGISELNGSLIDLLEFQPDQSICDIEMLRNNNPTGKTHVATLSNVRRGYLDVLEVGVFPAAGLKEGVQLRCVKKGI